MSWLLSVDWVEQLSLINAVLTSGIVIHSFALLIYILLYNSRNNVARAFCAMLGCVLIVYFADLIVAGASIDIALRWLRLQWIGIALTPATYLTFSDALLQTTNDRSRVRRFAILGAYAISTLTLILATFSDILGVLC